MTSPVRLAEFQAAIDEKFDDSAITDELAKETAERKAADQRLTDEKADKDHKHDADTAPHEHPEYETKENAYDTFSELNRQLNKEIKDRQDGDTALENSKSDKGHTHDHSEMVEAAKEALGDLDDKIDAVDEKVDQEIQDRTDGDAAQAERNDAQDARLDEIDSKLFNGEYTYKAGGNAANTGVVKITKMDGDRLYTQINPTDLNGQEIDMKFFVNEEPTSWIIDGVRYDFERGSYNLSANYLTANVWTADGGLDGFEVPANGAEVIVNTPAEPFDIAKYATIDYSDGKDEGLSLRIDSLEQLTTGNEADLGGASWTMDDAVRGGHFTTRKDDPSGDEFASDVRMVRQWLLISKEPASGGDTDQWYIGDSHPATLTVRA